MVEDRVRLCLECCKALLIAFGSLGIILEADAALIGENDYCIAALSSISGFRQRRSSMHSHS